MLNDETIVNRIITADTILDVANYFEDKLEDYKKLYEEELKKNEGLKPSEQMFKCKLDNYTKVEYEIEFKDGKIVQQTDYNWFVTNISNHSLIRRVVIFFQLSYRDNSENISHGIYKTLRAYVSFYENMIYLKVSGKETEEETYNIHTTLRNMLEDNEERYNKTVKNRNLRIQSFCLSIGFILSYIIYIILLANKTNLPEVFVQLLNNKYFLIFGQWIIALALGNLIGYPIMMNLYRDIIPKARYSHYSKISRSKVYYDDMEDFIGHDEVQIGKFANNGRKRALIEKIYKITNKIVLVQFILSIIYFFILK